MLDPEYLERAGTIVGSVYSQIEAEMCDRLVRDMLDGDISDWHDQRALALLAQGEAPKLRAILEEHREDIDEAVLLEVEEALERSDAHDLAVLKKALGVDLPGIMPMQVMGAVRTVTQMLERDNVAMLSGARDLFYSQTAWAVTQAASGVMGYDEAIRRATRELARKGISVIQYRDPQTGDLTVRSAADVAVTRHVRSQLSQQCAARTLQVCGDVGCEFVEVSSHYGARPSHQEWEGRRYHVGGRVTVDGVAYEDFAEATGYYGTGDHGALGDRLCGVNCRHQFGPWMPGMPHAYEPNPQHPSGRSNEEIYRLTQKQRRLERAIRASKRELAAAERAYEADPSLKSQTAANQLRQQLRRRQDAIAKLVGDNEDVLARDLRREWAGDMPKVRVPEGAKRSISEYLAQPTVAKRMEDAGISLTRAKRDMAREMRALGLRPQDFRGLDAGRQSGIGDAVFSSSERRAETKIRTSVPDAMDLETAEGVGVRDSEKLRRAFGVERAAELGVHVEAAVTSGDDARANAARVFVGAAGGEARYRRVPMQRDRRKNVPHYQPSRREVQIPMTMDVPSRTVVHETLHLADYQQPITYGPHSLTTTSRGWNTASFTTGSGYIKAHLAEDWRAIEAAARADGLTVADWLRLRITSAGLSPTAYDETAFVSDMIDAASNGAVKFSGGHTYTRPDYWTVRNGDNIGTECLANYGASAVCNPVEYDLMRMLFPTACATMDELLEVMAGG